MENTAQRVIGVLLKGIALDAADGEKTDHERFQIDMDQFEKAMSTEMPVSKLLMLTGGMLPAMEDSRGRHVKFMGKQSTEMQNIVLTLTLPVIAIAANGQRPLARLRNIEKVIESANGLEDNVCVK